jgi:hypothetical protein
LLLDGTAAMLAVEEAWPRSHPRLEIAKWASPKFTHRLVLVMTAGLVALEIRDLAGPTVGEAAG